MERLVSNPEKQAEFMLDLFSQLRRRKTLDQIAAALFVRRGTIDRWERTQFVPTFYKNDFLRILGRSEECDIGVEASDMYYTLPGTSKKCFALLMQTLGKYEVNLNSYCFVEPSAGCGHFFEILPRGRRIGLDIAPAVSPITNKAQSEVRKMDFLCWTGPRKGKHIAIGNPPFGRNGKTALDFVLKSFEFADFVGFILPPIFDSTGKGSCRNRLTRIGHVLLASHDIKNDLFVRPDGAEIHVKTIFQVWAKQAPRGHRVKPKLTCGEYVEIYNICVPYKPSRSPSNIGRIGKCDVYLPRSFWKSETAKPTRNFDDIPYKDGYGIIVKKRRREILRLISRTNWGDILHTSTNGSKSLRRDIICEQIIKGGFHDRS
ncbi:MAG: hypothetical protein OD918_06740 [Gammaproteobacteria bacterium]